MELPTKFKGNHTMLRLDEPLTIEQMCAVAPSICVDEASATWSARYGIVPTSEVLLRLANYGFSAFMIGQSKTRDTSKREHTRHMVRLRHQSFRRPDVVNELVLLHSDDAPASYHLLAGVYRLASRGAMVCGTKVRDVKVRQSGDAFQDIIEGVLLAVDDFRLVDAQREAMQALWLTQADQIAFAKSACSLRWDDPDVVPPVTEHQLLHIERPEDNAADLWTTLSRVHEHLTRGGLRGPRFDGRRATTRAIHAIDQNVNINRALWFLARAVLELKID